jgi:hypothetical protein
MRWRWPASTAFDVHMSDLQAGRARLADFQGLVACGGFSYGDTLGAGEGWARSVLFNPALAEQFAAFFLRGDTFATGRVQRLPDVGCAGTHHPRRRGLAALHAQPQRTVRGPAVAGGGAGFTQPVLPAAWPAAGCRSPSRTARVLPTSASVATRRRYTGRCASSTTTVQRPRPTPSTRTAARAV